MSLPVFLMRTLCGSFGSELCINGMDKMSRHTMERIEPCDLMQKNSADVSAICGKSRILFFNAQKRGRIGKRFSI